MLRVIIVGIITTALALAIALTLREDVGLRWFGPDFIAPGAKLPEATLGVEPPAAPAIYVNSKWIISRGERVAKADEVTRDPDLVADGLYEDLVSIGEEIRVGSESGVYDIDRDIIIQADGDVKFELLVPVLYTCARAGFGRWNLVAVNGETRELEAVTIAQPDPRDTVIACSGGTGVTLIERGGAVAVKYRPDEIATPSGKYDLILYLGDDWFLLPDESGGATVGVRNVADEGYFILRDKLLEIKTRHPNYKSVVIACEGRVKYENLIRVIGVSLRPDIRFTEIYLGRIDRGPR
jgi:biopolymer transport protein ExbD